MRPLLTLAALALAAVLPAQVAPDPDPEKALAEAQKRLATLDPKNPDDESWRQAVSRRVAVLQELIRTKAEHKALLSREQIEARKQGVQAELDTERAKKPAESVRLTSVDELSGYEQRFQTLQRDRTARQQALDKGRQHQQRAQKERQGLSEREARVKAEAAVSGDDELTRYRVATAQWGLQAVAARKAHLTDGLARWPALVEVLYMERDVAALRADRADKLLAKARQQAAALREAEATRAREKAAAEASAAKRERDPLEGFRRNALAEVARLRAAVSTTQTEIEAVKAQITDEEAANVALTKEKSRLNKRLAAYERDADRVLRRTIQRARQHRQRLVEVTLPACNEGARRNQAQLGDVLDRLWNLGQPEADNSDLQELLKLPAARADPDRARAVYHDVVEGTDGLVAALRAQRRQLEAAEQRYGDLAGRLATRHQLLDEYIDFVSARLFWTRNETAVNLRVLDTAWKELPKIADPYADSAIWSDTREALGRSPMYGAGLLLIGLFLVVALIWRFRRSRGPVVIPTKAAEPTTRARLGALSRALLASAVVPAVLGVAAVLVHRLELSTALELPLVRALTVLAWVVLVRGVANRLLAPGGVATRFLDATEDVAAQLLRSTRLITAAAVFLYLPLSALEVSPFKLVAVPRLLETAWFLCASLAMILVTRYRGPVVQRWTRPDGVARQVWRVIAPLFVVCMVVVLVLHVGGYRNGARHLMLNIARTFVAVFALSAAYKLFTAAAGRAIDAVAARRAQVQEGAAAEELEASIDAARRLTHAVAILAVVVAAFLLGRFWGFGGPLMGVLQEIGMPDIDQDGQFLTALDVFKAVLWVIGGHFFARNIGRIYDSVATRRDASEAGGRFALITLVRYLVIVVAYALALVTLGVDFTTLGWMATAASVGLGFGLQEIVANFISGLILLFERPVRVGDIIAVGETSGVVDRITIRSTYVTNWERQTFIVPNKTFVTQNVINWTRNDQVMRRVLKVGAAYGSDVDKVIEILEAVCKENPQVLSQPPHRVWFKGFGEYRLEFEIWVFTNISFGFPTMTALYTEIYKRLRQEGIEIPVPKRDVSMQSEGGARHEGRIPGEGSLPGADAPMLSE